MSEGGGARAADDRWRVIAESEDFKTLVSERRRTSFVLIAVSMGWFAVFLLLITFAKDFMSRAVFTEELTVAYVIGLSQFVMTFAVIRIYAQRADGRFTELEQRIVDQHSSAGPETTPLTGGHR